MITITGGKLTTWRRMAKMTVDRLVEREAREAPCRTHEIPLGQAIDRRGAAARRGRARGAPTPRSPRRYGHAAYDVLALAAERGELAQPIVAGQPDLLAEVALAARHEQARSVGDVLLRRTRLGLLAARELTGARAERRRVRRRAGRRGARRRARLGRRAHGARARALRRGGRAEGHRAARERPAAGRRHAGAGHARRRTTCARVRDACSSSGARPWLMGIVNASPDSFSDGGSHATLEQRVRARRASSARPARTSSTSAASPRAPAAPPVEIERGDRARRAADRARRPRAGAVVSVDTYKPAVARAAIAAGASDRQRRQRAARPRARRALRRRAAPRSSSCTRAPLPRERLQDPDLYDDVVERGARVPARAHRAGARGRRRARAADRRPRTGLREDARADDRAALAARPHARARAAAADGDLAQGLRRCAHRARRRASVSPARSPRSRTALDAGAHVFRVHDVAAAADFIAVRAALAGARAAEQGSRARRGTASRAVRRLTPACRAGGVIRRPARASR